MQPEPLIILILLLIAGWFGMRKPPGKKRIA
jgi:hypothetical protein